MDFLNCDIKSIPVATLKRALITKDTNGDAALRVVMNVDSGNSLLDCDIKSLTEEQLFRKVIILDGNGKPAINLAAFPVVP